MVVNEKTSDFEGLFAGIKDKLSDVQGSLKKLKESAAHNDVKLHDLTSNLRQQKDHVMSQVRARDVMVECSNRAISDSNILKD